MYFNFVYGLHVDTRDKTNRESPRINTNRIFLTFGCSASAHRLRRIAPSLEKCYRKNPRAGFSVDSLFFDYTKREVNEEKNWHDGFSTSIFPDGVRFCVGDEPKQSTTTQEKCDSR
ncbi:hypothetical protein SDC9_45718 [bioreactor metagenome]|uniref:Uncharacterized protein n=1 Tax=bioreactor metagenome TaxID=1076179 RepID=A0A644W7P8_9ZZZZ